jgi:6-phosphogluconolactonase
MMHRHRGSTAFGVMAAVVFVLSIQQSSTLAQSTMPTTQPSEYLCYIGTTGGKIADEQGIYVGRFDTQSGKLSAPTLAANVKGASLVEIHPSGNFLYATSNNGAAGYAIDHASGKLSPINSPALSGGTCHVSLDATGKVLLCANYGGGSVASAQIMDDGSIKGPISTFQNHGNGPMKSRQEGPHAHSFFVDPSNRFALSCDLGTDQVFVFKLDVASGKLTANDPAFATTPAGAGPRHLVFSPDAKFVYVVNELSSTITVFTWTQESGRLSQVQDVSMLPADFMGESWAAEIRIHPNGDFLYASNRGHDSIAIYAIDRSSGKLTLLGCESTRGKWPRNFQIDPPGQWLIVGNEHSNDLFVFKIDAASGKLTAIGDRVEVPTPSCVRFVR